MKNFIEKLDRQLGRWIDTMDGQLQEPVVRAITGEVFTHGTNGHQTLKEQRYAEIEQIDSAPEFSVDEGVVDHQTVQPSPLRKRTASAGDC